jgi:hypothetical protein
MVALWCGPEATAEAEFDAQGSLHYRPSGLEPELAIYAPWRPLHWSVVYICKDTKNDHVFCRIAGALPLWIWRAAPTFCIKDGVIVHAGFSLSINRMYML